MLSLFVGTITSNMAASLHEIKQSLESARKEQLRKRQLYAFSNNRKSFRLSRRLSSISISMRDLKKPEPSVTTYFFGTKMTKEEKMKASAKISALLQSALKGVSIDQYQVGGNFLRKFYWRCARICNRIIDHWVVSSGITITTLCAGVLVGIQTNEEFYSENQTWLDLLEFIVLIIFTIEMVLKVISEDKHPWKVFHSRWNCFDMLILIGSFVLGNSGGDLLNILRLLRLLRILKLIKIFPQLQGMHDNIRHRSNLSNKLTPTLLRITSTHETVVVDTLSIGFASVNFIGILLVLDLYVFALVGMILFAENDPWHFGSLQVSMLTLFRCATLEDW